MVRAHIRIGAAFAFAATLALGQETNGDATSPGEIEEMVVTAPAITVPGPELGQMPSGQFISQVYNAASQGAALYKQKRYEEALPFLVAAAKRGVACRSAAFDPSLSIRVKSVRCHSPFIDTVTQCRYVAIDPLSGGLTWEWMCPPLRGSHSHDLISMQ